MTKYPPISYSIEHTSHFGGEHHEDVIRVLVEVGAAQNFAKLVNPVLLHELVCLVDDREAGEQVVVSIGRHRH